MTILLLERFPAPVEVVMSLRQGVEIYWPFSVSYKFEFIKGSAGVFSMVYLAEATTN